MATAIIVIMYLAIFVVGPFILAYKLGQSKHRKLWWLYWLLGGWIGVGILACQSTLAPANPALSALELQVHEAKLRKELAELTK